MKGGHKICEIEEKESYPIGTHSWKEAFKEAECAYDNLLNCYTSLKKERNNLQRENNKHSRSIIRTINEKLELYRDLENMEIQRDNWRTFAELFMLGFIAICCIFIFYALNWH